MRTVVISQGDVKATFRLNDKEYEELKKSGIMTVYNVHGFLWADWYLTEYKKKKFFSLFKYSTYSKGEPNRDFIWYEKKSSKNLHSSK